MKSKKKPSDPRFVLKHALRLRNLFLEDNNHINDLGGNLVARLVSVALEGNDLTYTIRPKDQPNQVNGRINIGEL